MAVWYPHLLQSSEWQIAKTLRREIVRFLNPWWNNGLCFLLFACRVRLWTFESFQTLLVWDRANLLLLFEQGCGLSMAKPLHSPSRGTPIILSTTDVTVQCWPCNSKRCPLTARSDQQTWHSKSQFNLRFTDISGYGGEFGWCYFLMDMCFLLFYGS